MHGKTGRSGSITSCTATGGVLAVGAVWRGQQRSGAKSYDVEVRIAGVDEKGDVCGECVALSVRYTITPFL